MMAGAEARILARSAITSVAMLCLLPVVCGERVFSERLPQKLISADGRGKSCPPWFSSIHASWLINRRRPCLDRRIPRMVWRS